MDWQDWTAGAISALCGVLFVKHFFFPKRRRQPPCGCSAGRKMQGCEQKDAALFGKSAASNDEKRQHFSPPTACSDCPFCSGNARKEE